MKTLQCACCGSDVTMPQFHNGMVYGYTCIKKVAPAQKQTKVAYAVAEGFVIVPVGKLYKLVATVDGKKVAFAQTVQSMRAASLEFAGAKVMDGVCLVQQ